LKKRQGLFFEAQCRRAVMQLIRSHIGRTWGQAYSDWRLECQRQRKLEEGVTVHCVTRCC